jgi:DNA-binding NarL/FixJ family response regulator
MPLMRVLLVDDQALVRAGLIRILMHEPDIEVVGECSDGDEVVQAVTDTFPDVVVMDVRMKRVDGAEATTRLQQLPDPPPVLALTTFDDDEIVAATFAAGALGFILKDARVEDIIAAVRAVAMGGAWLDPAVAARVINAYRVSAGPRASRQAKLDELSEREMDVLRLIAKGATNHEIGTALFISEATVKSHIGRIFTKLDLRDRSAAIVLAYEHRLVEPGQHN